MSPWDYDEFEKSYLSPRRTTGLIGCIVVVMIPIMITFIVWVFLKLLAHFGVI